jgi:hypothetical protein
MTRINSAIKPFSLCDQHLLAEYRELPRLSNLAIKATAKPDLIIPDSFRLGSGHIKFFLDKGAFLYMRFLDICLELNRRGFKLAFTEYRLHPPGLNQMHTPTQQEFDLLAERILLRMPAKPRFTNHTKQPTLELYRP